MVTPAALAYTRPADDLADLKLSQNSYASLDPGYPATWNLTVTNPGVLLWDAELHRYYTGGAPAYGIVVKDQLPTGSHFTSANGDSGFSCRQAAVW